MMTWTLKGPNQPKHNAVHAVVLWLRRTKRRAGKPECPRRGLRPVRPSVSLARPSASPPPHLVFICVTSRAACLPSIADCVAMMPRRSGLLFHRQMNAAPIPGEKRRRWKEGGSGGEGPTESTLRSGVPRPRLPVPPLPMQTIRND